jgi:hypothetical protein
LSTVDERERRLAKNETLFRDLNERIEQVAIQQAEDTHVFEFLCECSNIDCTLRVELTPAAYEHARNDPASFIVAMGHELPEIEEVVFDGDGYQVVRKQGEAAELAEERDPRS